MNLTVDIVRPDQLSPSDVEGWEALRATAPVFANPLLSPAFAQAVGALRPDAAVALYRRGGALVGALAHHRRPGGAVRPIGAPFSDYHALITGPAPGLAGPEALTAAGRRSFRYSGLLDPHGLFGAPAEAAPTHQIVVDETPEAYLEERRAIMPKHFKNWRRLEHKAEREIGGFQLRHDHDEVAWAQVLDWKRRQLAETGRHDFLRPGAWTERLMQSLFARREGAVRSLMLSLWAGDTLMAAHFGLREGAVFHPWLAAMNPEMRPYSPGQAFLSQAVRAMPALGLTTIDLGTGHDHYKAPFANRTGAAGVGLASVGGARSARDVAAAAANRLGRAATFASIDRRLDHIAQVELSLAGRLRGIADAVRAKGLNAAGAGAEA